MYLCIFAKYYICLKLVAKRIFSDKLKLRNIKHILFKWQALMN